MTGPTRAEVLATPGRDADNEIRALLQAAEDCQPEWQPRPTRTTTLPSIDDYQEPEMTDDHVPPPPGSAREQLASDLLAVINLPPYLSTACQTAGALAGAAVGQPRLADRFVEESGRLHSRCRLNHKFTGQLCVCGCHRKAARDDRGAP
ncbi:MAG TPA: hypothetical protein VGL02_23400 [Streptomyces sp.]